MNQDRIDNSGARYVLLVLANFADERGFCYPSRETIARKTSQSVRAVQRHLNWLVSNDYVLIETRRRKGSFTSSLYRLKNFTPPGADLSAPSADLSPGEPQPGAKSSLDRVPNRHSIHHSETSGEEFKPHTHTAAGEESESVGAAVAVRDENEIVFKTKPNGSARSEFSLEDCLRYVEHCITKGEQIKNPKGLATHLFKTGSSDAFIRAALFPEDHEQKQLEQFGPPRQFSEMPCPVCGGTKYETVPNKGARPCPHCINERGKRTGLEPLDDG